MFVNSGRQISDWDASTYHSDSHFEKELKTVFSSAWFLVGTRHDLPTDGSYVTQEVLGTSVLVRRFGDELRAFVNSCVHRQSQLMSKARGCSAQLRCQYHGWRYDSEGAVCDIPDRKSFGPEPIPTGFLSRLQVAHCGDLVFVALSANAPPLKDYFGEGFDLIEEATSKDLRQGYANEVDVEANWKVVVENALESYHLPAVHPLTSGKYPRAEDVVHDLGHSYTRFTSHWPPNPLLAPLLQYLYGPGDRNYHHIHCFPNLLISRLDNGTSVQMALPLSPTKTRIMNRVLLRNGKPGAFRRLLVKLLYGSAFPRNFRAITEEDMRIYPAIQKGLQNSTQHAIIGAREERIVSFQKALQGWMTKSD